MKDATNERIENILGNIAVIKQNTKNRTARIYIRVSEQEKSNWESRAESYGVGLSDFVRTILNNSDI